MKKISKIILIFLMMIIAFMASKTFATDTDVTLEDVSIAAPEAGIYGVGQEITITFKFNKPIKGQMPKYSISFGTSTGKIEIDAPELTEFTDKVDYKYTIKSGDNGQLKPEGFVNASECEIEDEAGNKYLLSSPIMIRFEKNILADTTIDWTDFSSAKVKMVAEDNTDRANFEIVVENCNLKEDNEYYVHVSHTPNESIKVNNQDDIYDNWYENGTKTWQTNLNTTYNEINLNANVRNMFAENGDIYITICEIDKITRVPKIVLKSKKIDRLELLPLTQRISAYFLDDETNTFCWEIYGENERKVNYKIGKVTDLELLRSLKDGKASAFEELMDYAKKSETIATGTVKLGRDNTITDKLNLVDDEYYFVYLELDTENGKYYEIQDVSLYQALVSEEIGKHLYSITDKKFEWNLDEEEPKEEPEKEQEKEPEKEQENKKPEDNTIAKDDLPDTGINIVIIAIAIVFLMISVITFKKYKLYKDIK